MILVMRLGMCSPDVESEQGQIFWQLSGMALC